MAGDPDRGFLLELMITKVRGEVPLEGEGLGREGERTWREIPGEGLLLELLYLQ